jgi:uncharacterized protein DUF6951
VTTARATIDGGICGFQTRVVAEADDDFDVRLEIEADCPRVRSYTAGLDHLNALAELGLRHEATVLAAARDERHGACVGCVIAAGIYKTMQVAAGLALPAESRIAITTDEP